MTEAREILLGGLSAPAAARLSALVDRLVKWNRAINLVAPGTLSDVWRRHMLDSAQLYDLCPDGARLWLDLGSGGGFPGLVVAALAKDTRPELRVELVESDQRKCVFLQQAVQDLDLSASVLRMRIEDLPPRRADVVSARALARLAQLCAFAEPHLAAGGLGLFLKGEMVEAELAEARLAYRFHADLIPSRSDATGVVVQLSGLAHV